jgi:RNA polymerase sigma factor (sigma-70 family)
MSTITTNARPRQAEQAPTDPSALYEHTRDMLYKLARRIEFKIRMDGGGHGDAEVDELVNTGYVALAEARGRYDSRSKARYTTYARSVAYIAMWRYALACHYGLSLEQHHRMTSRGDKAPWHYSPEFVAAPVADDEERASVRRVRVLLAVLNRRQRQRVQAFLEEGGNYSALARRIGRNSGGIIKWFHKLYARLRSRMALPA